MARHTDFSLYGGNTKVPFKLSAINLKCEVVYRKKMWLHSSSGGRRGQNYGSVGQWWNFGKCSSSPGFILLAWKNGDRGMGRNLSKFAQHPRMFPDVTSRYPLQSPAEPTRQGKILFIYLFFTNLRIWAHQGGVILKTPTSLKQIKIKRQEWPHPACGDRVGAEGYKT